MNLTKKLDFSNEHFYIGNDVHKKCWKITVRSSEMELKTFSMDPNPEKLADYMNKNYPNGVYHSVYEAGFSGYKADTRLKELGFENIIVSPSDVPRTNKEKSGKTDKIDSRKLSRELANGSLTCIYIPDDYHQQLRSLCRMRQMLVRDETRVKNRIKSMFMFYGKDIVANNELPHWSRKFIEWLRTQKFEFDTGNDCLTVMIDHLVNIRNTISQVIKKLKNHCRSNPEVLKTINLLKTVPGIGFITALTIYTEIIDINRFQSVDHLLSFIGLVPSVNSSGEKEHINGLTKRANRYLRSLIIESSWTAIRTDPALTMRYNELKKRMKGQEAIIHIAKKLVKRIRFVWKQESPYRLSIV
jgi:transposase